MVFNEQFISYFTVYSASILWGLYLKWFLFPLVCLVVIWHYWIYGLAIGATSTADARLVSAEYRYWLPLTSVAGIYIGWSMTKIFDFNRMLFLHKFDDYLCWLPVAAINFVSFNAVLFIWDLDGRLDPPINYWVTFAIQVLLLIVWYFVNAQFDVFWMHERVDSKGRKYMSSEDNKLNKFSIAHAVLTVSTTVIFAIVRGVAPGFWPFWIFLITFGFHLILVEISRRNARKRIGKSPGAVYDALANAYGSVRSASAAAVGMPEDVFTSNVRRVSERPSDGGSGSVANSMELAPLTSDMESGGGGYKAT